MKLSKNCKRFLCMDQDSGVQDHRSWVHVWDMHAVRQRPRMEDIKRRMRLGFPDYSVTDQRISEFHFKSLLSELPDMTREPDFAGQTWLHLACRHRLAWAIEPILATDPPILCDAKGRSPLDLCVDFNARDSLRLILDYIRLKVPASMRYCFVRVRELSFVCLCLCLCERET